MQMLNFVLFYASNSFSNASKNNLKNPPNLFFGNNYMFLLKHFKKSPDCYVTLHVYCTVA